MTYKDRENPSEKDCFRACQACFRCENKGRYDKCDHCSGRHDPDMKWDPEDFFDRCRCSEGILQIKLQTGRRIVAKYPHDPYGGTVTTDPKTSDEEDWEQYLYEMRSKLDDPTWDPIQFEDGSSVNNWVDKQRKGEA